MSGHSHWATIKRKKGAADAQRSKMFAKLANELTIAARGNPDPEANPRLRTVIDKAREANMPSDNIAKAIKRGSGEGAERNLQELLLEAYGPGGIALLIEGITDNKNRTLGELKQILAKRQGKLVDEGAVRWMFERKGTITAKQHVLAEEEKETLELALIEAGAEDLYWYEDAQTLDIYTMPENLASLKEALTPQIEVVSATLDWVPKEHVALEEKERDQALLLFEDLAEHDAVQEIYSNLAT